MKPHLQEYLSRRDTFPGLHTAGLFAGSPGIGLALFLLGSLVVGVLAYQVWMQGALLQWDMSVAKTFRAMQINAPWSWMETMLFGVFLGEEVVFLIATVLALYFLHKRFWRELALVAIGLGGAALIGVVLSRFMDRPRPTDHLDVLLLSGPSFPSIPAALGILCYGLLAYLLVPHLASRIGKLLVLLVCILAIGMVTLSSLLFGTHYASDVIAGVALGLAWAGLAFTVVERYIPQGTPGEHLQKTAAPESLHVPGWFKRRPLVGLAVVLVSGLLFAAVAVNVLVQGPLVKLDLFVYRDLLARARAASPLVNDLMLFGFFVGKQAVQWIVLGLSLYFLWRRRWLELAILQISTQGGGLLKNFIMDHLSRPRPPEQLGLVIDTLSSFPSGHTLGTTICFGFLAYLLLPRMPSPFWKWSLGIGMVLLLLFEGLSRIFYGNHYLSDVLAGYLLGIAWLVFVITLLETVFIRGREATREASL